MGEMKGLEGIRVVEVGQMIAVPWATRLIADLGADVIKIEPPQGDLSRHRGPYPNQPDPSQSGLFTHLNLNKRSVVADLGEASDVARLHDLLGDADLLVHDLSPETANQIGLHENELAQKSSGAGDCFGYSLWPYGTVLGLVCRRSPTHPRRWMGMVDSGLFR